MTEFSVKCTECSGELDTEWKSARSYPYDPVLVISPCNDCLTKAKDESETAGYDKGYAEGLKSI